MSTAAARVILGMVVVAGCSTSPRSNGGTGAATATAIATPPVIDDAADAADAAVDPEIEAALHGLWSEHAEDVRDAAWWKAHAAAVRPTLRAWLSDGKDDGNGDLWAIRILGDLGHPDDVPILAAVMAGWSMDTSRSAATSALAAHPDPAALEALVAGTRSTDLGVVIAAAGGLVQRKDPSTRPRLEELLDHADPSVRYRAVQGLAAIGGSRPALARRRKIERDSDVKAELDEALK